jgi:ATP-dependent helicase/DNAse subunit B
VPLKLVIGPANSAKARIVLAEYVAHVDEGAMLVVPTRADVDRYRRELAASGSVFGTRVVRFAWLIDEMAKRGEVPDQPIGRLTRERVAAAAVARTPLRAVAGAAATPGFVTALVRLVDELEEQRIDPPRWYAALRAWTRAEELGSRRGDFAEDVAALYAAYRRGLDALGRLDAPLRTARVLDALRLAPARWRETPVALYGFDDFAPLQLDAIETLARHCQAQVTVSLPYEPGRRAFSGRAETFEALRAIATQVDVCPARETYYGHGSRTELHHLERHLFGAADGEEPQPVAAADALLLLEGGGPRAELELVGRHVARLLRAGVPAEEIAVVLREPAQHEALIAQVFGAYGIAYALERRVAAGHCAVGRALVALARCVLMPDEATADDLLSWLRAPGMLQVAALADRLESDVRRAGLRTAAAARALWEERHWPLHALDRVAEAAHRGPGPLYEALAAQARALLAAPFRRRAPVLAERELEDARAAQALVAALGELAALAAADPGAAPAGGELVRILDELAVFVGDPAAPGAVAVADPLGIRARRVRALFLCGLQEGDFPAPARPDPFLGDAERREINKASGLRLRLHADRLARERSLFYAATSRPTELLALSWHAADDDGSPKVRSLFVDDVLDLFEAELAQRIEVRELGAAGWPEHLAPSEREALVAQVAAAASTVDGGAVIAPLRHAEVLATLEGRQAWSASAIEAWVACPVKWFVERFLAPQELVPDPEPVVRGELAHRVLEEALRALQTQSAVVGGGEPGPAGPLRPEQLEDAKRHAHAALARLAGEYPLSVNPERLRAALRRLEADIVRYLEHAAHAGSQYAPTEFELRFGAPGDPFGPVAIGDDGLRLQGRIDRVDVAPNGRDAIVYDYKGKNATPQKRWEQDRKLQIALYMIALPELLGLRAVGGLYQPLGARELQARGLLLDGADPGLDAADNDRVDERRFAQVLQAAADAAGRAVAEIRAGRLEPRPATCGWRGGGCTYPSICRCSGT